MKTTLTISKRGIITIPMKIRKEAGIQPEDILIAENTPDGILLRTSVTLPLEMYSESRIVEFDQSEAVLEKMMKSSKN